MNLRGRLTLGCMVLVACLGGGVERVRAAALTRAQQTELLIEAQRAFDKGIAARRSDPQAASRDFADAASRYQLVAESGVRNGHLYFNLANACLEGGHVGRAILNYRRAERLLRGDGRVEANLRFARSLRRNEIPVSGERALLRTLFFWHYGSSPRTRSQLGLLFYIAFWALLVARGFAPRRGFAYALVPCAILAAALASSVAIEHVSLAAHPEGVITADDVVARKGDSEGFEPQFQQKLHQGVEFRVLERRGDWLHIELPDGKSGWIRAGQAALI